MPNLSLNSENLPYPDPMHPVVIHFVIAMVFFSFFCDVLGYFTRNPRLLEVGFWNLFTAAIAVFVAVFFGQVEAGLAAPYDAAKLVLTLHTLTGWSLSALLVAIAAWRLVIRNRNPLKVSVAYLGAATILSCLVFYQMILGSQLVWVYGLHVEPVVEAQARGLIQ